MKDIKIRKRSVAIAVAAVSSLWLTLLAAQVTLTPESKLWIVGDSTMHAYHSEATKLNTVIEFDAASTNLPAAELLKGGHLKKLELAVPVKEMHSGKGMLDKNMQKSLKAEANPDITFKMEKYEVAPDEKNAGKFLVKATGLLKIAGVEKSTEVDATAEPVANGVHLTGQKQVLMSDYGIKPPQIMMIKCKDLVVVNYDWTMQNGK